MKDIILPATSKLASNQISVSSASSCVLQFKLHCSILPARRPSSLPVTISALSCVYP